MEFLDLELNTNTNLQLMNFAKGLLTKTLSIS
jgi:hypothetical protein